MVLFIIGNGFDIGNGMRTGYKQFYHFLKNNHNDFFNSVTSLFLAEFETDRLWCEFEECLSAFTPEYFIDNKLNPQKTSEIVLDFQELLSLYFKEWIANISLPDNKDYKSFSPDSFFINFNYTDTLEKLYNVPYNKILHIHGQASELQSQLIIGHSSKTTIDEMCESYGIVKNGNLECTVEEINYLIATEMMLFTLRKPTEEIIKGKLTDLDFQTVSEIVVLGHSLGIVDWPYFKYIKEHLTQPIRWNFSAYSERDKEQIYTFIRVFQISDYSIDSLQNLISKYSFN